MMENHQPDRLISAFLSGKATPEECRILEEWIKGNPENNSYFQEAVNIWQTLHPAFDPESIDTDNAEKKIRKQIGQSRHSITPRFWTYWQRIAAILIIPLFILSAYLFIKFTEDPYKNMQYQELIAPHGMLSQVNLPDGSKVWLNGGSSLKYPVIFKPGERNVILNGEGYFEVNSDKKNPFIVTTEQITLKATGTAFNIEAYNNDTLTAVTMVDGVINLSFNNHPDQTTSLSMKPGERAIFDSLSHKWIVSQTDPYKWYAWKDGLMIFRDDPLSYVFKRLELTFNVEIDLKDQELASAPYRATFEVESLDEILRLLELSAPLHFVHQEREKTGNNYYEKQRIEVYKGSRSTTRHPFRR